MTYKIARAEYTELMEELESERDDCGKPWDVLRAYIEDEFSLKELECFLSTLPE